MRPTLALLLLLVAGTLSGFWLLSSEDRTSAAARPAAPQAEASRPASEAEVPTARPSQPVGPRSDRSSAGPAVAPLQAPEPGTLKVAQRRTRLGAGPSDGALRARFSGQGSRTLMSRKAALQIEYSVALRKACQPLVDRGEASLEQEQEVPEGAVWYQGLDAEGRSRVVVVSRTTSPELYAQRHELDWLEAELARRGR